MKIVVTTMNKVEDFGSVGAENSEGGYFKLTNQMAVIALAEAIKKMAPAKHTYRAANYVLHYQEDKRHVGYPHLKLTDNKKKPLCTVVWDKSKFVCCLDPSLGDGSVDEHYKRIKSALRLMVVAVAFQDFIPPN